MSGDELEGLVKELVQPPEVIEMKTFLQNEAGFPISEVNYVQTCHLHAFVYCYGIFLRL